MYSRVYHKWGKCSDFFALLYTAANVMHKYENIFLGIFSFQNSECQAFQLFNGPFWSEKIVCSKYRVVGYQKLCNDSTKQEFKTKIQLDLPGQSKCQKTVLNSPFFKKCYFWHFFPICSGWIGPIDFRFLILV